MSMVNLDNCINLYSEFIQLYKFYSFSYIITLGRTFSSKRKKKQTVVRADILSLFSVLWDNVIPSHYDGSYRLSVESHCQFEKVTFLT